MESCIIIGGSERGGGTKGWTGQGLLMSSWWQAHEWLACSVHTMDIELQIDESDYRSEQEGGKGRGEGWVTRSTDGTLMTTKGSIAYLVYATLKLLKHFSCFWGTLTLSTRINLKYFALKKVGTALRNSLNSPLFLPLFPSLCVTSFPLSLPLCLCR